MIALPPVSPVGQVLCRQVLGDPAAWEEPLKEIGPWTCKATWVHRAGLHRISGRSIADEYRHPTWDLESSLRGRRLKWAGQILNGETRWLQQTVEHMAMQIISGEISADGTLLMDAPHFTSLSQLHSLAGGEEWEETIRRLNPPSSKKRRARWADQASTSSHEHWCWWMGGNYGYMKQCKNINW